MSRHLGEREVKKERETQGGKAGAWSTPRLPRAKGNQKKKGAMK